MILLKDSMEEQPVTEQRVVAQPKSRHHWFRISLFIVAITISLFTLGCLPRRRILIHI